MEEGFLYTLTIQLIVSKDDFITLTCNTRKSISNPALYLCRHIEEKKNSYIYIYIENPSVKEEELLRPCCQMLVDCKIAQMRF